MPASGWLQTIVKLAKMRPCVIRGNASEIMALAGAAGATRGVDSTAESEEALALGKQLSLDLGAVVAISGKDDYVRPLSNSHGLLDQVVVKHCASAVLAMCKGGCMLVLSRAKGLLNAEKAPQTNSLSVVMHCSICHEHTLACARTAHEVIYQR